ncbi:hypothetical protein TRFO_05049 [Tritrichomonas foetus]|uniref:Uncharacterized protein n=1 Tax=Tritrichomonas foetus TaxID=1144522 RepID=A0A1J4KDZ2_9EUKA|nr:hypothetical protein TRFO_05049 [Tritrichomonas foetus]|eukprot:OHT07932.1 hypothetical protein TRFO_05049 [Tritrichomonas foetus]
MKDRDLIDENCKFPPQYKEMCNRNYNTQFSISNLQLQILSRQNTLLTHFASRPTTISIFGSSQTILKSIEKSPRKLINKYSSHILNRLSMWTITLVTMPNEAANSISKFYTSDNEKLKFFGYVTFPALFHHFKTDEFNRSAAALIFHLIASHPLYIANVFVISYFRNCSSFFEALWHNYDSSDPNTDELVRLTNAIKKANVCLTRSHVNLLFSLYKRSKTNFGRVIYARLLYRSYIDFHEDHENSPLAKILLSISLMVRTSQFDSILNAFLDQDYAYRKIPHNSSGKANQTPIVLSSHEIYCLQSLVKTSPEIFKYPKNEPSRLMVPNSSENDFEQIYFDLDLTLQLNNGKPNFSNTNYCNDLFGVSKEDNSFEVINCIELYMLKEAVREEYNRMIEHEKFTKSLSIKLFSKQLLELPQEQKPLPWYSYFYLDRQSTAPPKEKEVEPKIESKAFKYSLHKLLKLVENQEAKLWIYLRSYSKCERSTPNCDNFLKIFNSKRNIKMNDEHESNLIHKIVYQIKNFSTDSPCSIVENISRIGFFILNIASHLGSEPTVILSNCIQISQNRQFAESVAWCQLLFEYVPEIRDLMPGSWISGSDFIIEAMMEISTKNCLDESDEYSDDSKINKNDDTKKFEVINDGDNDSNVMI